MCRGWSAAVGRASPNAPPAAACRFVARHVATDLCRFTSVMLPRSFRLRCRRLLLNACRLYRLSAPKGGSSLQGVQPLGPIGFAAQAYGLHTLCGRSFLAFRVSRQHLRLQERLRSTQPLR